MTKTIALFLLIELIILLFPLPALAQSGFHLVPCGRSDQAGTPDAQCQFKHLIILIVRLINYLMTVAALVAMYFVLLGGFNLVTSMGNPEKIKNAKTGISNAVVGFAMVILAFVFVNLLVNGIFGTGDPEGRRWWNVECIYNPGAADCPFSTQQSQNSQ